MAATIPISTYCTRRIRATTIQATTDIFHRSNRQQQLFPAAALRICDHHLHSSGIIPRICNSYNNNNPAISAPSRIYEHDWFCVSQAVECYDTHTASTVVDDLSSSSSSSPPPLMHRVVNGTDSDADTCYCDVWVDSDSIGKSSIQFGGLISIGSDVLAVVRRVFVRMAIGKLKSAPFSDQERQRFCSNYSFEALNIGENYKASDTKKIQDLVQIKKRPEFNTDPLKTIIIELESSSPPKEELFITRIKVGPQHINFGNHADHAFLAETAFHALTISSKNPHNGNYMSIQYLSEVLLGDVLESYPYRQHEEDEDIDSVILVATREATGERKAVLIVQGN